MKRRRKGWNGMNSYTKSHRVAFDFGNRFRAIKIYNPEVTLIEFQRLADPRLLQGEKQLQIDPKKMPRDYEYANSDKLGLLSIKNVHLRSLQEPSFLN